MKKDEVRIQSLVNLLNRKNLDGMVFFHPVRAINVFLEKKYSMGKE